MVAKFSIVFGSLVAIALLVTCLWAWQTAPDLAIDADHPDAVLWAVRTASIAAGALAQTVLLIFVVGNIYRTRAVDILMQLMTATVFAVSLVSAIALGLVGH